MGKNTEDENSEDGTSQDAASGEPLISLGSLESTFPSAWPRTRRCAKNCWHGSQAQKAPSPVASS